MNRYQNGPMPLPDPESTPTGPKPQPPGPDTTTADEFIEKYYTPGMVVDGLGRPVDGWVRRAISEPKPHECRPPTAAAGDIDDLWRCHCRKLWRVGRKCDTCDHNRSDTHRGGYHVPTKAWRPATLWQRIRYRGVLR